MEICHHQVIVKRSIKLFICIRTNIPKKENADTNLQIKYISYLLSNTDLLSFFLASLQRFYVQFDVIMYNLYKSMIYYIIVLLVDCQRLLTFSSFTSFTTDLFLEMISSDISFCLIFYVAFHLNHFQFETNLPLRKLLDHFC